MIKTAVVLVGGEATRLKPLSEGTPKALVEVGGKPLLYWIVTWLKKHGIEHLVLAVADKRKYLEEFMQQNNNFGLKIDYSENPQDSGTAGAFKLAIDKFVKGDHFLAMNGDELTNFDLTKMMDHHLLLKPKVTMALAPFHCRFSVVNMRYDSKIVGFDYGPKLSNIPISIGIYIFNRDVVDEIPGKGSIEDLMFSKLARDGHMHGHMLANNEEWATVNTVKELKEAEERLKSWKFDS